MNKRPRKNALSSKGGLTIPSSVGVVGASSLEGGSYYGARLFDNMLNASPQARIYAINPRRAGEEIRGHRVYAGLSDLPETPQMLVISSPVATVLPVLEEAADLGVGTAVVISAHRGDATGQRNFDTAISAIAERSGMRVIGPNSMGVLNGNAALSASFTTAIHGSSGLNPGGIATIAQSGAAIAYLLHVAHGTNLGFSWLISTGNEAGASLEVLLDDLLADPASEVIMLFVEGLSDGLRFRKAALAAQLAGKAIVMLNAGRSEAGREAVLSHTGRIAGKPEVINALAHESHITVATSYTEFFDAAKSLSEQSIPRRDRAHRRNAVVVTTSGGAGTVASDQLSAFGWTLPALPADVAEKLSAIAKQSEVANPVDVTGAFGDKTMLPRLLDVLRQLHEVDAIFVVTGAGGTLATGVAQALCDSATSEGPELYVAWVGMGGQLQQVFDGSAFSAFADPLRAIRAGEASATFRNGQARKDSAQRILDSLQIGRSSLPLRQGLLSAAETIAELHKAGTSVAASMRVASLDAGQVLPVAEQIGYPLVLKIDTPELNHKSDQGGVRLGIADAEAVETTLADFHQICQERRLNGAGVLVQPMLNGVEVFVGLRHEAGTGHLLVLGLGGTHAELHADSAISVLLPTDDQTLAALIDRHCVLSALVAGYRGDPACDRVALNRVISDLASWGCECGEMLREADFNPIIATPTGAYVVDARAVITAQGVDA